MKARREPVAVVTDAARSRDEEFQARRRRYLLMMAMRVVFLLVACVLARWSLWAALALAVVGTLTPWFAVMMANDGPPKTSKFARARYAPAERTLAPSPARAIDSARVVDGVVDGVPVEPTGAATRGETDTPRR